MAQMTVKDLWGLVKAAASGWVDDYAQSMGAALAYYTMFSIAPLLLILISIAGLVFGDQAARGEIFSQLEGMLGAPGALAVQGLLESVREPTESGFLLMASLVASAALAALRKWWGPALSDWAAAASIIELGSSFLVITVVFAMIYKIMPRVRIDWKDVWIGATATSLLFTVGKFLIGVYIGRSGIASGFGAAASLVVVLVCVYYSAQT